MEDRARRRRSGTDAECGRRETVVTPPKTSLLSSFLVPWMTSHASHAKLFNEAISFVTSWLSTDSLGARLVSSSANQLWRGVLLHGATTGDPHTLLLPSLAVFPALCPRLLHAHMRSVEESQSLLRTTVIPLLTDTLEKLSRVTQQACDSAGGGGGGQVGQDMATLLTDLRQALAVRMCTRVQWVAQCGALDVEALLVQLLGDDPGGGRGGVGSQALAKVATQWKAVADDWVGDALEEDEEFLVWNSRVSLLSEGVLALSGR